MSLSARAETLWVMVCFEYTEKPIAAILTTKVTSRTSHRRRSRTMVFLE